jgi:hypothetical protein
MATLSPARTLLLLVVELLSTSLGKSSLPTHFYTFGTHDGDSTVPVGDDGYSTVSLDIDLPFANATYRTVYVMTNGLLAFDDRLTVPQRMLTVTPRRFPILDPRFAVIAPYWADVDTSVNDGRVYYRQTTNSDLLSKATSDIRKIFTDRGFYSFTAEWLMIVTWYNVTFYGGNSYTPRNTFQAVVISDGKVTFVLYNYWKLTWTCGMLSGNCSSNGVAGTAAVIGYNSGSTNWYDMIDWSLTDQVLTLTSTTNAQQPGRWAWLVSDASTTSSCLPISRVASEVNLALRQPTWQISTQGTSVSSLAVDGNNDTLSGHGSCIHTEYDVNKAPWWAVDLGRAYVVGRVYVTNRGDCCGNRLANFTVGLTNTSPDISSPVSSSTVTTLCGHGPSVTPDGQRFEVKCTSDVPPARYVFIRGYNEVLNFCEVEVYEESELCPLVYQRYDDSARKCQDIAPAFWCPILSGPTVIDRLYFQFECSFNTSNYSDPSTALYNVTFVFDGVSYPDVPVTTTTAANPRVTLHERYLAGHLGKSLSCRVMSYFSSTPDVASRSLQSVEYFLGIRASTYDASVAESAIDPQTVTLHSTLPITCPDELSKGDSSDCILSLSIDSKQKGIVVRQRYPGLKPLIFSCLYVIRESDWKPNEKKAYNARAPLEVIAQLDPYTTAPRLNQIEFYLPTLPNKTVDGITYANPWSGYHMRPNVLSYRYDDPHAVSVCSSAGDPHFETFDGVKYSLYGTGTFIYTRSVSGLPLEVQVRLRKCNGGAPVNVSCICGIALREADDVVAIDRCNDEGVVSTLRIAGRLPPTSGIFIDEPGRKYKLQVPSGTRIVAQMAEFDIPLLGMDLIVIGRRRQLEGLCGSPNENYSDDLRINGDPNEYRPDDLLTRGGFYGPQLSVVASESWRVDYNKSLFTGHLDPLTPNATEAERVLTYCECANIKKTCGGPAIAMTTFDGEPNFHIDASIPEIILNSGNYRRKKRSTSNEIATDDVDAFYDPSRFSSTEISRIGTAPAVTDEQIRSANGTCWNRIVNVSLIGPECASTLSPSSSTVQNIVGMCIKDVLLTGSTVWADDKIGELQRQCQIAVITQDNRDLVDPDDAINKTKKRFKAVNDYACSPFDCTGHGQCVQGKCVCRPEYIGADCAISRSAVPNVRIILDPSVCDAYNRPCRSVTVYSPDAASVDTLRCKVDVSLMNIDSREKDYTRSYNATASLKAARTVRCPLPDEPLRYISSRLNFTGVHGEPSFNFSCLYPGSPVTNYTVSISNDGLTYGTGQTLWIVDTSCFVCTSPGDCTQRSGTCLINGYCFQNGDRNPYLANCYECDPTVSTDSWTLVAGVTRSSCSEWTKCVEKNERCVPYSNQTYECVNVYNVGASWIRATNNNLLMTTFFYIAIVLLTITISNV